MKNGGTMKKLLLILPLVFLLCFTFGCQQGELVSFFYAEDVGGKGDNQPILEGREIDFTALNFAN